MYKNAQQCCPAQCCTCEAMPCEAWQPSPAPTPGIYQRSLAQASSPVQQIHSALLAPVNLPSLSSRVLASLASRLSFKSPIASPPTTNHPLLAELHATTPLVPVRKGLEWWARARATGRAKLRQGVRDDRGADAPVSRRFGGAASHRILDYRAVVSSVFVHNGRRRRHRGESLG